MTAAARSGEPRRDGSRRSEHGGGVEPAASPGAPVRFLDQRLEIGDPLREVAIVVRIGRAGFDGDGHRDTSLGRSYYD
jgi:hypothetical protein